MLDWKGVDDTNLPLRAQAAWRELRLGDGRAGGCHKETREALASRVR